MIKSYNIEIEKLFKHESLFEFLPTYINVDANLKLKEADIDVVICAYNFPELTNAAILNFLKFEKNASINIIVVESSGNKLVFDKLIENEFVSKILITEDICITHNGSVGSWGMAISSAIGAYFSKSKYVFFSHSDMVAMKTNFLGYLKSKLNDKIRIASFTQRHIIPFTGCMMVDRRVLENINADWAFYDMNHYLKKDEHLFNLNNQTSISSLGWIDCGEAFIYNEIVEGRNVYICASKGGRLDYWKDMWTYFGEKNNVEKLSKDFGGFIYANTPINKDEFGKRYKNVVRASNYWFWEKKSAQVYWRYSFDEDGDLIFIHHGRGTTEREVKKWLKFVYKECI